jgi:transposase
MNGPPLQYYLECNPLLGLRFNPMTNRYYPAGIAYPDYVRANVIFSDEIVELVANEEHVSTYTVSRYRRAYKDDGRISRVACAGGHPYALTRQEAGALCWFVMHNPAAQLKEMKLFLTAVSPRNIVVGESTISDELNRLGFSFKKMWFFSNKRDETDRVNFMCNQWDDPVRNGICGMNIYQSLDLDEASYYTSRSQRKKGHGLRGAPLRVAGFSKRGTLQYI